MLRFILLVQLTWWSTYECNKDFSDLDTFVSIFYIIRKYLYLQKNIWNQTSLRSMQWSILVFSFKRLQFTFFAEMCSTKNSQINRPESATGWFPELSARTGDQRVRITCVITITRTKKTKQDELTFHCSHIQHQQSCEKVSTDLNSEKLSRRLNSV